MNKTHTRLLLAGIAAGAGLIALGSGTARADTTDVAFLSALAADNINAVNGGAELIEVGHEVCALRIAGNSESAVTNYIWRTSQLDEFAAGYFVGAAEQAYCPAFAPLTPPPVGVTT